MIIINDKGSVPEWSNGADCKSADLRLRWFESIRSHSKFRVSAHTLKSNGQSFLTLGGNRQFPHLKCDLEMSSIRFRRF